MARDIGVDVDSTQRRFVDRLRQALVQVKRGKRKRCGVRCRAGGEGGEKGERGGSETKFRESEMELEDSVSDSVTELLRESETECRGSEMESEDSVSDSGSETDPEPACLRLDPTDDLLLPQNPTNTPLSSPTTRTRAPSPSPPPDEENNSQQHTKPSAQLNDDAQLGPSGAQAQLRPVPRLRPESQTAESQTFVHVSRAIFSALRYVLWILSCKELHVVPFRQ